MVTDTEYNFMINECERLRIENASKDERLLMLSNMVLQAEKEGWKHLPISTLKCLLRHDAPPSPETE